jgi:ABC-type multidrug transport system ATPase subunit
MTAIMGASGSGKTTLLNLLSSRSIKGNNMYYNGDLLLNDNKVSNLSYYKNVIGFVPQEDVVIKEASVKENFEIYGDYRRVEDRDERVNSLVDSLGLSHCQHSKIGNEFQRGVSGGELKRVSIGVELMSQPEILFLDEPTTSLDANTALDIILLLKDVCRKREIGVICVIHQPRREILEQFDQIMVLSDGNLIYDGTFNGIRDKLNSLNYNLPYFETEVDTLMKLIDKHQVKTNLAKNFDLDENEIEWLSDLVLERRVAKLTRAEERNNRHKRSSIIESLEKKLSIKSFSYQDNQHESKSSILSGLLPDDITNYFEMDQIQDQTLINKLTKSKYKKFNMFMQFLILLKINLRFYLRNKMNLIIMFVQQVVTLILIYLIFKNLGDPEYDTIIAIQNRQGMNALMSMYGFFSGFWSDVVIFVRKRKLFQRDQQGGYYGETAYYLANQLYALPFFTIAQFLVCTFFFFVIPLNQYPDYVTNWLYYYFFIFVGGFLSGTSLGSLISVLSDKEQEITSIMAFIIPPLTIATGFYNNMETSTVFIQGFSYLSPTRFSYQGLMINEFQNFQTYIDSCYTTYACPTAENPKNRCRVKVEEKFKKNCNPFNSNEFVQSTMFENMLYVIGLILFYRIVALSVFHYKNRQKYIKYKNIEKSKNFVYNLNL